MHLVDEEDDIALALDLVDKARDLLPEHQSYRQEQQREKGHSWGDMSL